VLAHFGRIDILVNNAGTVWGAPAEDYPLEGWNKVIDLNVTGLFLLTQAVAKRERS
jgi:NAD(P)-dependent dehydrogenase (short-subunit alcohol dehydrogenase family)